MFTAAISGKTKQWKESNYPQIREAVDMAT